LHVPFCENRCGYCNLLSLSGAESELISGYLDAVARQAERVRGALCDARFVRLAIGGGTPTLLAPPALERLLATAARVLGTSAAAVPASVEVSPATATPDRLIRLRQFGIGRLSIGVQTFDPHEAARLGRPQSQELVEQALHAIRAIGFPVLNVDLMYDIPGQTAESWGQSLRAALAWRPEEIFLYPLYVRPLTALATCVGQNETWRRDAYRMGRDLLLHEGYQQVSMRMFRAPHATAQDNPPYCCLEDGMVGLGCGARSYTRMLHYSTPYAVGRGPVRELIERFAARTSDFFDWVDYGVELDAEDQRRRYVVLGLLECQGLARDSYAARFGSDPVVDLPELKELAEEGLMEIAADCLRLTPRGLAHSDTIGPRLYSRKVRDLMESCSPC
jgi:coproporphyrinogen III oxidase-like Fe-S oxidoreductase